MTFREMQTDVRNRLTEATSVFFSDDDIKAALNDGLAEISDSTEWYERQATITMQDRNYYDLSQLSDTFLSLKCAWNSITQRWMQPTTPREMDNSYRQWEIISGMPERYLVRGLWWLGLWPKSSSDQQGARIYYSSIPPAMVYDSDKPDFPEEFHFALVEYALSDLLAQQRETLKALERWQKYYDLEQMFKVYVSDRQRIDRVETIG